MKSLPDRKINFHSLYEIVDAPIRWHLLRTALNMEVFGRLETPLSAADLSRALGSHAGNTEVLLKGLTAMGLLRKNGDTYVNTELARLCLCPQSETYLGGMLKSLSVMRTQGMENLEQIVLNGPPAQESGPDLENQSLWKEATSYLGAYQRAGVGQEAVEIARSLPEWPGFNKMLDLGGGAGMIGLYLVLAHPKMKGVLFDLPKVCENALPLIREYDSDMRMQVLAGDYNEDQLGEGYDLVWASLNLYYAKKDLNHVMAKIHQAMNPGGVFISYHEGLHQGRVSPAFHVLGRIAPAFRAQDFSFDQGEIADSMLKAGFARVHSKTIETVNGPIDLDIARKKGGNNGF
ncbi:methyltransferase [Dethiosulfatarculus sandiegensis]|uniref:O-methyltransferase n=1 Tax=Dethiosulfatarculus sandiegensis TaxID=1429043 RepID=A0A0D2HWJ0_9BACT|nr:methyltransferase [Dethiosulfatarculus sandiegensis]KIX14743.1 hypothetical protein X474_06270 [Dethiosulfatarculus sandiegensis]